MYLLLDFTSADLKNALANTVVGMGTVFVALIVISFIIASFSKISVIQDFFEKKASKKATLKRAKEDNDSSRDVFANEIEDNESSDNDIIFQNNGEESFNLDYELVAIITAAIMAYSENECAEDGLIVRSIRRVRRGN